MNFFCSSDAELIKTRFQVNESAYPCTRGVWLFIIIKNKDEAILLFDTEVGNIHLISIIIFSNLSF